MDDDAVLISLTEEERLFVDSQIAAGKFADDAEILHAGLAALEQRQRLQAMREMIAEADAQIDRGDFHIFKQPEDISGYIVANASELRRQLNRAAVSGESGRNVVDVMAAVKSKLRAEGTL